MSLDVAVVVLLAVVPLSVAYLLGFPYLKMLNEQRTLHAAELLRLEASHAGERDRLAAQVKALEYQLASHVAHVLKLPPPVPPIDNGPKPEPLPEVVQKFLEAIEDEEARAEYEGDFRARLALGADAHKLVAEAMSA